MCSFSSGCTYIDKVIPPQLFQIANNGYLSISLYTAVGMRATQELDQSIIYGLTKTAEQLLLPLPATPLLGTRTCLHCSTGTAVTTGGCYGIGQVCQSNALNLTLKEHAASCCQYTQTHNVHCTCTVLSVIVITVKFNPVSRISTLYQVI
jgi:hypothetical protein